MALGTFALGMAEFSMMGVLSDVADAMSVSISRAGDFISAYALGVACGAPALLFLRKYSLRNVLILLAVIIMAGNAFAALSWSYGSLVAARFLSGLPHGAYFGAGAIAAARVVPRGRGASAVAMMVAGMSVSTVVGVPFNTYMAGVVSWRVAFGAASAVGLLAAVALAAWMPDVRPSGAAGSVRSQFAFLRTAAPWLIFAGVFLGQASVYCWYSYVEPIMTTLTGFSASAMTWVMVAAGLGMVVGGLVAGRLADRYSAALVAALCAAAMIVVLPAIYFTTAWKIPSVVLTFIATAGLFGIGGPLQYLITRYARGGEMLGGAGIQIAFNVSNAVAAALGGAVIHAGFSLAAPALVGVPLAVAAAVVLFILYGRCDRRAA